MQHKDSGVVFKLPINCWEFRQYVFCETDANKHFFNTERPTNQKMYYESFDLILIIFIGVLAIIRLGINRRHQWRQSGRKWLRRDTTTSLA